MRFVYVDELGMEWEIDKDGSLLLPGLSPWPASDEKFLELCGIEPIGEIDDGEL